MSECPRRVGKNVPANQSPLCRIGWNEDSYRFGQSGYDNGELRFVTLAKRLWQDDRAVLADDLIGDPLVDKG